jgi:hypothetical protein
MNSSWDKAHAKGRVKILPCPSVRLHIRPHLWFVGLYLLLLGKNFWVVSTIINNHIRCFKISGFNCNCFLFGYRQIHIELATFFVSEFKNCIFQTCKNNLVRMLNTVKLLLSLCLHHWFLSIFRIVYHDIFISRITSVGRVKILMLLTTLLRSFQKLSKILFWLLEIAAVVS